MKNSLVKYKSILFGVAIGAVLGYAYYYFVGCQSGTCPITSNPIISTLYGALMGGILGSSSKQKQQQQTEK
jgi:gas vesicle protein